MKLVRRGQTIPKARHANMFLVRSARDVMDSDIQVLPTDASFDDYVLPSLSMRGVCAMLW